MKFLKPTLLVLVALLIGAGATYYATVQYPEFFGLTKSSAQTQSEIDALVADVRKLMDLPTDERPTVATVSDADKIKTQTFFAKTQNGDKVLIYPRAKKAILYRPSENKIVEVGAVNINQTSPAPQASGTAIPTSIPTSSPKTLPVATP